MGNGMGVFYLAIAILLVAVALVYWADVMRTKDKKRK